MAVLTQDRFHCNINGELVLCSGFQTVGWIEVPLIPGGTNPYPKMFQVVLTDASQHAE